MSQDKPQSPSKPVGQFIPENQQERWLKYGSNVLLTSVVVILLAAAVVALAQYKPVHVDTTSGGVYTLHPQTLNMLAKLDGKVTIIGLQTKTPPSLSEVEDQDNPLAGVLAKVPQDQKVRQVEDLLSEFHAASPNITVEMIDPVTSPTKVDGLIADVTYKYGGDIDKYKQFIDSFNARVTDFKGLADKNVQKITPILNSTPVEDETVGRTLDLAIGSIDKVPQMLDELKEDLKAPLATRPPDYVGAKTAMQGTMSQISQVLAIVLDEFHSLAGAGPATQPTTAVATATTAPTTDASTQPAIDTRVPLAFRQFMIESYPDFQKMKDIADKVVLDANALPDLKLDELRQALQTRDAILVEGDSQWKVIPAEKLWINDVRDTRSGSQDETRARFNGEQQVTGAILDLALKGDKPVVAFVRSGGEAMTGEGQPMFGQAEGPYNAVAENLMSHNFQVIEKDFGAEPNPEEPDSAVSDKQVNDKNTVWVVMDLPGGGGGPMGGGSPPPTNMIQHIGEHLRAGGSVLVCAEAMSDDLHDALNDWGIDLKPSVIAMHKHVDTQSDSDDIINQALQIPYLFRITDYGNADFLKPIQSLPGIFPPLAIVETHPVAGKTLTPILPVPGAPDFPDCWGSVTGQAIMEGTAQAVFHPDADTKAPIFGGAVSEQSGGGRLIVIGSWQFATSRLVEMHDPHNFAVLLPGNGEIFADSVYWLARKPEMIALSASAEDVSRIADMSSATKTTWWIVILGMLPAAVIASGAMVYTSRRS